MLVIRFPGLSSLCYNIVILVIPKLSSKTNFHATSEITKGDKLPFKAAVFCIHVGNKDLKRN